MFDDNASFDFSSNLDGLVAGQHMDDWSQDTVFSPWDTAASSAGHFGTELEHIDQTTPFTCAVVSQQMILKDFGIELSEAQLVYDATVNGWLTDSGTSLDNMGNLLELHGISTHTNYSGDLPSLINELAHGHKVIVPVNSGELWNGVSFWQRLTGSHNTGPDHAIVVSGVDFSNPDNPMVVINDPGAGVGAAQSYPLEHFLEAWNDSNCMYLATDNAPENLAADAQLGAQFNDATGFYMAPQFWLDIAIRVAGPIIINIIQNRLNDSPGTDQVMLDSISPWVTLNDTGRDQLFLDI